MLEHVRKEMEKKIIGMVVAQQTLGVLENQKEVKAEMKRSTLSELKSSSKKYANDIKNVAKGKWVDAATKMVDTVTDELSSL